MLGEREVREDGGKLGNNLFNRERHRRTSATVAATPISALHSLSIFLDEYFLSYFLLLPTQSIVNRKRILELRNSFSLPSCLRTKRLSCVPRYMPSLPGLASGPLT